MTERMWSQSSDDATDPDIGIVLAQADAPAGLSPSGPLEPTGPLDPTASDAAAGDATSDSSGEATTLPRDLVEVEEAIGTPEAATAGEQLPSTPSTVVGELDVAPLGVGERRVLEVPPGTLVTLNDPAFDPEAATYVVSGNDLIVTLANGGVLVLTGFFAPNEIPPQLSVLGAPPTTPAQLLARAEEVTPPDDDVAAGPPDETPPPDGGRPIGGASSFRAYDQGDIGDGLDPLGPLGPTALAYTTDIPELDPIEFVDDGDGDGGDGPPPPPDTLPPQVTLRAPFEATVGEQSGPAFNPVTTPVLPIRGGGQAIPDDEVNSVDQRNLTLDVDREVFIRFVDDNSFSVDSLFVHEIGPNGEIQNVRLVFDGVNKPGDPLSELKETPVGTEFSIGTIPAGTQIGFVLVNDGLRLNDFDSLEGGRFEFRNVQTGEPSTIFDFHSLEQPWRQPRLFHIADDGTETQIVGPRFFTADASQQTPLSNRLNPEGAGAIVSGWDSEEGLLVLGVEDSFRDGSRDFAGLVFGVRFGSSTEKVLVIDGGAGLGALITDPDSTEMVSATIVLTGFDGDRLVLDDAIATGTGITVTRVSDTEFNLEGLSSIENYETVISAATIEVRLDDPILGERDIAVTVEDPDGNTGSAVTSFTVDDNLLIGDGDGDGNGDGDGDGPGDGDGDGDGDTDGSGDDTIIGTSSSESGKSGNDVISGRAGDDFIDGRSGDDFIDGGDGKDTIIVRGSGNNTIIGGPQPDLIILSTGPGVDRVVITGLADGKDTIRNFDATEGDRLDLSLLFRDSDISADSFGQFVRTSAVANGVAVQVDLDGAGGEQRFVDIAVLERPVGVTPSTDPSSFVITPDNDPAVT